MLITQPKTKRSLLHNYGVPINNNLTVIFIPVVNKLTKTTCIISAVNCRIAVLGKMQPLIKLDYRHTYPSVHS